MTLLKYNMMLSLFCWMRFKWSLPWICIYFLYCLLWNICDFLETFAAPRKEHLKGYRKRVLFRARATSKDLTELPSPLHFFGIGYDTVDYNYVLADNVTLYCVYNGVAMFVETPNHIYDTFHDPYFLESQFYKARNVIFMPLSVAHKLSQEIGDPPKRVICLSHTGRAGSTLVAQILNRTGKVVTISMPDAHRCLMTTHKNLAAGQKQQLTILIMRLICKPVAAYEEAETIVVKQKSYDIAFVPLLIEYVPWIKHVFLHRGGVKSVRSISKKFILTERPLVMKIPFLKQMLIKLLQYHFTIIGNPDLADSSALVLAWYYLSNSAQMYKLKAKYNIPMFTYEDITDNTDETLEKLFQTCGLTHDLVLIGKRALKYDSQDNSISLKEKGDYHVMSYKGDYKKKVDKIAEALNVPKLDENINC